MRFLALFKNHKVDKVLVCIFEGFYLKIKDHFYIFNNVSIFVTPVSEVPHALDKDHSEFVSILSSFSFYRNSGSPLPVSCHKSKTEGRSRCLLRQMFCK